MTRWRDLLGGRLARLVFCGVGLSALLLALGLIELRLAAGLALLSAAGGIFSELVREDGWAKGALGTYAVVVASLAVELTLPFLSWYDLWLTTLCGFGATLSAVTAAGLPYLERGKVPDMMDQRPADDASMSIPARELGPRSQKLLLVYSQLVMVGNFLVVWHTIRQHAGQ